MITLWAAVLLAVAAWVVPLDRKTVLAGFLALLLVPLAIHAFLPVGPLHRMVGGSLRGWGATGVAGLAVLLYLGLFRHIKGRAGQGSALPTTEPVAPSVPDAAFSATELDRYARHIVLREVGGTGQKRLKQARVLVVGAGGLGSPALLYLAAAGVGTIGIVDDDEVSNSNLQRQIIHSDQRIGSPKVRSAERSIRALNPHVAVELFQERLAAARAPELIAAYDLVLDGSDNFDTRYLVNEACVAAGKPLVSAAITQWEGQIGFFDPARGGPCYACVFPERPADGLAPACAEAGVIAPLPGVMGAMMALEAVKYLTGAGSVLRGELLLYDGLWAEVRKIRAEKRADCPVCGHLRGVREDLR